MEYMQRYTHFKKKKKQFNFKNTLLHKVKERLQLRIAIIRLHYLDDKYTF